MRKSMCLLLAACLLAATFNFGGRSSSAQSSNAQSPNAQANNGKVEDELTKALKKNWDKLPPQAKLAADPKAKAAWEGLTPKQQAMLKKKVHELFGIDKGKFDKEKLMRLASQKSLDDVIKSEVSKIDEESTLTYVDGSGNRRSFKAKRRDGSARPQREGAVGAAQGRKGDRAAGPDRLRGTTPSFTAAAPTRPAGRAGRPEAAAAPWLENWAFDPGRVDLKRPNGLRYAKASLATGLAPQAGCVRGPEQFIRNFYDKALARQPNPSELSYWLNAFAQAQAQGDLLPAAQNLGSSIFLSPEYAGRGRSNRDFVYDCYRAYLFRDPEQGGWDHWTNHADTFSQAAVVPGFAYSIEFNNRVSEVCNVSSFDGDNDTLPDNFENTLADGFTPAYHVSQGEPDQYATFEDNPTLTIKQRHGQNPVSHFRVLPLFNPIRFNPHAGRWESLLRIDYLSLWDHDSGFVGQLCFLNLVPPGGFAHELDGERSALLVSAPAVCDANGCHINQDPNAYSALSVYTAAHEGVTPVDHSGYWDFPNAPKPVGTHLDLWQALQKHSTYTFNPDYYPIVTIELQFVIFAVIEILFYRVLCWNEYDPFWDSFYWNDFYDDGFSLSCDTWTYIYYAVIYYAVTLLFVCLVERFHEQGPAFAQLRINVGEPSGVSSFGIPGGQPLNGSAFINDNSERAFHLYEKLIEPLDFEFFFQ